MTIHDRTILGDGAQAATLSRRSLLKAGAGLAIGVYIASRGGPAVAQNQPAPPSVNIAPNTFLIIGRDNTVTVLSKHIEFGQGPFTGMATLVAEELDADWSQMRAEHAPSNPALYKNLLFGVQGTGGSSAIANSYEQMRKVGAAAREMLVAAAAESWQVPASEIKVENGVISHGSGKQGRFGEFADKAMQLPVPEDPQLKDPANFKLIGKEGAVKRLDSAAKSNGSAVFTLDINEPGMLTVLVARSPKFGGKVASFDAGAAKAIAGVVDVKQVPTGVAVYANGFWPAKTARDALKIVWDDSEAEQRGTADLLREFRALSKTPGKLVKQHGDVEAEIAQGGQVIEAEFAFPYLAHAPMEPLNAFMKWDGETASARYGSQFPTPDHATIAQVLGLPIDKVSLQTILAGGSFGRRAQQTVHVAAELAEVAKAIGPGKPVKLVWTREDDMRGGYYRPFGVHRMRGMVRDGQIVAWSDTIVGQSIMQGSPFEAMAMKNGLDSTAYEGSNEIPYEVANFRCDLHQVRVGVPVLWWRSVGHTHTGYAVEAFIDQLLEAAGQDPVEGRLALMKDKPRHAGVLKAVAELANWKDAKLAPGRARGVAVVESFKTFVAQVVELSVGEEGPKVHKVWCAVDCGVAVNPDIIRAQMEGGIGFALGHILYAAQTIEGGVPVAGNFDKYRSLRIHEMPQIEVTIVNSQEKPTGVGEPGVPPLGPAVANAMAKLGLPRPRQLPIVSGASA
ncbi:MULTISPECIES: xanthine dehydrogenase family protein molybdopterin-binding subunit [Rhodopseudomonas]|uniref:Aldehyde oxidase n=1 Tax=Rhodopseudomonas palustris TaxID=1076 RepID=A0A0D7EJ03_RHOPL|nr:MULTISPECIES: xanthine dehydrogenase family protein molybdopterin-binding subunit [Rhodopseudomonas]KIZ40804.1 aldehyde oxidase [Rhodopseudomonas palustris]MDF3812910.1 xanthine dehydrogenase family protein molybdopterin-binding subunit [Rhodopseudomonas sp. BAL398]WOK18511.1 xanthine dehydrogenase family protein molybdopterin-binding subunit [Rhodopseudomonas sp. BAL398]